MTFAFQLKDSLHLREAQVPLEMANGASLNDVLNRHLLAVEAAADTEMLTSILLLDGIQLRHGAAPNLPPAYCSAIDGSEIGPCAGSCGAAAFLRRPVYVDNIDTDPLWADYREYALAYGLQACWSTPILNDQSEVIGTFAIYHLTPRAPTSDEVKAIQAITGSVARTIEWSNRSNEDLASQHRNTRSSKPALKLVERTEANTRTSRFLDIAMHFDELTNVIDVGIARLAAVPGRPTLVSLRRAKMAAMEGATLARRALVPNEFDPD